MAKKTKAQQEEEELTEKRKKAARKAWDTRIAANPNCGSEAALKAWATRRKPEYQKATPPVDPTPLKPTDDKPQAKK